MDFDFENYQKYLEKPVSANAQNRIDLLNSKLNCTRLSERELKFIDDVKNRIRNERSLSEKQRIWLAKIIQKCA